MVYLARRLRRPTPDLVTRLARTYLGPAALLAGLEVGFVALLVLLAQAHHPLPIDRAVHEWLDRLDTPLLRALADRGDFAGTLPVVVAVAVIVAVQLRARRRPWREVAALFGALLASEAVGLLVVGLLRYRHLDVEHGGAWPFGYAGLIPLRAVAVYGMTAHLLARQDRRWGRAATVVVAAVVFLTGLGMVWSGEQGLLEVLLESLAGGLVLVAGVWWLQADTLSRESDRTLASVPEG
jgi:hypothetical protein